MPEVLLSPIAVAIQESGDGMECYTQNGRPHCVYPALQVVRKRGNRAMSE
jgi:hypothetical protein